MKKPPLGGLSTLTPGRCQVSLNVRNQDGVEESYIPRHLLSTSPEQKHKLIGRSTVIFCFFFLGFLRLPAVRGNPIRDSFTSVKTLGGGGACLSSGFFGFLGANMNEGKFMQTGWICPKCGSGNAPALLQCPCSTQMTISCTDGTGIQIIPRAKFTPPTVTDVEAYCKQRGNKVDPVAWVDYYTSNGWKVGRTAMKNWQAAVRTWEKNNLQKKSGKKTYEDYQNALKPKEEVINVNNTFDALD